MREAAWDDMVAEAHSIIDTAIDQYNPTGAVALFSGGDDSRAATHVTMQHPFVKQVAVSDTGTGVPETLEFVQQTCREQQWPLTVVQPLLDRFFGFRGAHFRHMVSKYGCPGPAAHLFYFVELKEKPLRPVRAALQEKPGDKVLYLTGVRTKESKRRKINVKAAIQEIDRQPWVSPIWTWDKRDTLGYGEAHGLPRNPVSELLHMSGECLCLAYGSQQELSEVAFWYPDVAARLREAEALARDLGLPATLGPSGHGSSGGKPTVQGRLVMEDLDVDHGIAKRMESVLCGSCTKRTGVPA